MRRHVPGYPVKREKEPKVSSLPNHIKTDYTSFLYMGMCGSEGDTQGHVHATHTHTHTHTLTFQCMPVPQ